MKITKIGIATYSELPDLHPNDQPLIAAFKNQGIEAIPLVWDDTTIDWASFDAVLIRNVWDYFSKYSAFLNWIDYLKQAQIRILNPYDIIKNNTHKFYLEKLSEQGIKTLPTIYVSDAENISSVFDKEWDKIVIKPAVSAGAYLTEVFDISQKTAIEEKVQTGDWLVQPFIENIKSDGEVSLVFFNGKYQYSILKMPKVDDFRVQRQFGGSETLYYPDQKLIDIAQNILSKIVELPLFARIDGVWQNDDFSLIEIEMIEPDLFFNLAPNGIPNFVSETLAYLNNKALS